MKRSLKLRIAAVLSSIGLVTGVAACTSTNSATSPSNAPASDAIKVVTSTKVWSDIADKVTDDTKVSIEPIISNNDIDPHSYQPSAADMAKVEGADILLAGGGHYDAWLTSALKNKEGKVIVSALSTEDDHDGHDHDHDHDGHDHDDHDHASHNHSTEVNEHVWYNTSKVKETAEHLADALKAKGATASAEAVDKQMDELEKQKDKVKAGKVAQIHPLADDILKGTKLTDTTPEGYRKATLAESEPSAADVNEMLKLIESGDLAFLIDAPQTHDQVSERLLEAAKAKGVKIVNVYEAPSANQTYFDLYKQTLTDMENV